MNLEVENFYAEQGELLDWNCQIEYPENAYKIIQNEISEEQLNSYLAQGYELVGYNEITTTGGLEDILLLKIPTEKCFWIFGNGNNGTSTSYTLLATPIKDAEPQSEWSFLIKKNWTYGEITTNLLLILVLGVFVWDMLRRMLKTKFN